MVIQNIVTLPDGGRITSTHNTKTDITHQIIDKGGDDYKSSFFEQKTSDFIRNTDQGEIIVFK